MRTPFPAGKYVRVTEGEHRGRVGRISATAEYLNDDATGQREAVYRVWFGDSITDIRATHLERYTPRPYERFH